MLPMRTPATVATEMQSAVRAAVARSTRSVSPSVTPHAPLITVEVDTTPAMLQVWLGEEGIRADVTGCGAVSTATMGVSDAHRLVDSLAGTQYTASSNCSCGRCPA